MKSVYISHFTDDICNRLFYPPILSGPPIVRMRQQEPQAMAVIEVLPVYARVSDRWR